MAKTLLLGYVIAVSICMLWPAWMAVAALQMMESATWRTWVEAARALATGWLFFVVPAVLLYLLLARLPDGIARRLNRRETERRQAEIQARARSLNPVTLPERQDDDTEADAPEPPVTTIGLVTTHLFTRQPVASTFRWRLLVSFLLWPLLGCLYFLCEQLLTTPAAREHFTNGLMATLLLNVYYTLFPLLGYWLVSELLLHKWPQWFASVPRHYATALLTGVLAVAVCQWLDPALRELPTDAAIFPTQDWYLLLGAGSGVLLAAAYRIPVALSTYFGDDSPTT